MVLSQFMGFITKIYQVIPTNNLNCILSAVFDHQILPHDGRRGPHSSSLVGRPPHERQLHLQKIFQSVQCGAHQTLCLLVNKKPMNTKKHDYQP